MIANFRTDAGDLDVLPDRPNADDRRLSDDELAPRAEHRSIGGVVVAVASLEDIIAFTEHADRVKDREALAELHRLSQEARDRRLT